jgi:hypothetical protein
VSTGERRCSVARCVADVVAVSLEHLRLDGLLHRARVLEMDVPLGGTTFPPCMSMVCPPSGSVVFVQWYLASTKQGRPVNIDESLNAIWPTASITPVRSFADAAVVHPAIGVHLRKARKDRAEVPRMFIALKRFWEVATNRGQCVTLSSECCACMSATGTTSQCPLCQLVWHTECSDIAFERLGTDISAVSLPAGAADIGLLPSVLRRDSLCTLCAAWLGRPHLRQGHL